MTRENFEKAKANFTYQDETMKQLGVLERWSKGEGITMSLGGINIWLPQTTVDEIIKFYKERIEYINKEIEQL